MSILKQEKYILGSLWMSLARDMNITPFSLKTVASFTYSSRNVEVRVMNCISAPLLEFNDC